MENLGIRTYFQLSIHVTNTETNILLLLKKRKSTSSPKCKEENFAKDQFFFVNYFRSVPYE